MKKWLSVLGIAAMSVSLTACLNNNESSSSKDASGAGKEASGGAVEVKTVTQIPFSKEKVYVIGVDSDFLPMGYEENGEFKGFSTELATMAAERAGVKYKIEAVPFDVIFDKLEEGKVDIIASSASITPEREKRYLFTDAYFISGSGILIKKDNKDIQDFNDLIKKGIRVSVEKGTNSNTVIADVKGVNVEDIEPVQSSQDAVCNVLKGKTQAAYGELSIYNYQASQNPSLKVIEDTVKQQADFYGFLSRNNEAELINKFNDGLNQVRIDGNYAKLYEKYFGNSSATMVVDNSKKDSSVSK